MSAAMNDLAMLTWFIGTMGFSYDEWSGSFYPSDLANRNYLSYYSRVFDAVEIDSTFYGTPAQETVHRWATQVPENFRFALKMPRIVTHEMAGAGNLEQAGGLARQFIEIASALGERLGAILVQFPPSFQASNLPSLDAFLAGLPYGSGYAVEVRHPSWYTPHAGTAEMLRNRGVCWAATEFPSVPPRVTPTASFLYVRWLGKRGTFARHDQEQVDRSERLAQWRQAILEAAAQGGIDRVFGFVNNEYAGYAPATANRIKALVGLPVEIRQPPRQGRLL